MKIFSKIIIIIIIGLFIVADFNSSPKAKAYDANNLASDAAFINIHTLSVAGIQAIFIQYNSFLKNFSENGRSAAQIIYDAAHGHGDASGVWNGITIDSSTGTINPIAILATIQKEEGIVSGYYSQIEHYNQVRVDWAMGYAVCDSCSLDDPNVVKYKGFTKQVEWGAWQLRYNYERAYGHGFGDYQVGQTQIIDGQAVTFANRATASLYRYTPHLGTNFSYYFELWSSSYQATHVSQSSYPTVTNGQVVTMTISYRNTGSLTWTKGVVNLGLVDRNFNWLWGGYDMRSNWLSSNRLATLNEDSVAPGSIGTFTFTIANSNAPAGNHRLDVGLVADGITWFNRSTHAYWDVWVP